MTTKVTEEQYIALTRHARLQMIRFLFGEMFPLDGRLLEASRLVAEELEQSFKDIETEAS